MDFLWLHACLSRLVSSCAARQCCCQGNHVMYCSAAQVRTDVRVVKEALGLEPCSNEAAEAAALKDVKRILQPHMGVTWPCGNPNNRT